MISTRLVIRPAFRSEEKSPPPRSEGSLRAGQRVVKARAAEEERERSPSRLRIITTIEQPRWHRKLQRRRTRPRPRSTPTTPHKKNRPEPWSRPHSTSRVRLQPSRAMKNPRSEHHATAAGTKNRSPSGLLVWTPNTKPKPA